MPPQKLLNAPRILVIDDEPDLRTLYELTLLREGYLVDAAASVGEARALLEGSGYDLVITDMRLPDGSGIDLLRSVRAQQRRERCIVITAYGSAENAVESLKAGAFDYLTKPVDLKQFRAIIAAATSMAPAASADAAQSTPTAAKSRPEPAATDAGAQALARMAGDSDAMCNVRERIAKVARSMAPVMVCGESGTGKELVAQALHANSHRQNGPWIAVNCGAIPENLLEAEFFGAKKGAYTGASHDRTGYFQAAHGGTLFLDEIGDLPLAMQAKLFRIVSATHKDLSAEVAAGRFRQDLFYRLNVIDIHIPPLRERPTDLPALCDALLRRIASESGSPLRHLSTGALAHLAALPLAGNVRELENLLHRAVALSDNAELELQDVPQDMAALPSATARADSSLAVPGPASAGTAPGSEPERLPHDLQGHLDEQERAILVRALQETSFNRTVAAKLLGLSLRQIRYRIARLKIDAPEFRNEGSDHV